MEGIGNWFGSFDVIVAGYVDAAVEYPPNLLGAIALLLLGWLAAFVARSAVRRFGQGINDLLARVFSHGSLAGVRLSTRAVRVAATVVYWAVVLFFIAEAASFARLEQFAAWLDRLIGFLPSIIGGGLIIFVGYIISTVVRDVIEASLASTRIADVAVPAMCAQGATFLVALVIGVEQIGVDITFLIILISILPGGGLLSLAVAFGLGAKGLVSNLVGAHDLSQHYQTRSVGAHGWHRRHHS